MTNKALIAMSGGVDSSVAAALIKEQGFECTGITLKLHDYGAVSGDAEQAARVLGIPHQFLDLTEAFGRDVIKRFIDVYEAGGTPNPCVYCNRFIKFNLDFYKAAAPGFDVFVTGHYARTEQSASGCWLLKKALDPKKDQSYVLYSLSQEQLGSARFPLGELTKNEVRDMAVGFGFSCVENPESQDICFVPDGDYGAFMENYSHKKYPDGDILDIDGKIIGRHKGLVRYTIGQRRGTGVAMNRPVYVMAKNAAANTITVGDEKDLFTKTLVAGNVNLIACETLDKPIRCMVRTRYLQQEKPALVEQTGPDVIRVTFDEGHRAVTPGQAVVLYDGDLVIGGGIIH